MEKAAALNRNRSDWHADLAIHQDARVESGVKPPDVHDTAQHVHEKRAKVVSEARFKVAQQ